MPTFVFYSSLKPGAQKAFNRGDGTYRKYAVDGDYIAVLDSNGRAQDWIKVVRQSSKPIAGRGGLNHG